MGFCKLLLFLIFRGEEPNTEQADAAMLVEPSSELGRPIKLQSGREAPYRQPSPHVAHQGSAPFIPPAPWVYNLALGY